MRQKIVSTFHPNQKPKPIVIKGSTSTFTHINKYDWTHTDLVLFKQKLKFKRGNSNSQFKIDILKWYGIWLQVWKPYEY